MSYLDVYLGTLGPDDTNSIVTKRITSTAIAKNILFGGYAKILNAYKVVYSAVMDPKNLYEFPATIVSRSIMDVETLLAFE